MTKNLFHWLGFEYTCISRTISGSRWSNPDRLRKLINHACKTPEKHFSTLADPVSSRFKSHLPDPNNTQIPIRIWPIVGTEKFNTDSKSFRGKQFNYVCLYNVELGSESELLVSYSNPQHCFFSTKIIAEETIDWWNLFCLK